MITRSGAIVSYDRKELMDEVRFWYGDDTADQVMLASLPIDERIHVLQHRRRRNDDDE
jgi:hypothetical protein